MLWIPFFRILYRSKELKEQNMWRNSLLKHLVTNYDGMYSKFLYFCQLILKNGLNTADAAYNVLLPRVPLQRKHKIHARAWEWPSQQEGVYCTVYSPPFYTWKRFLRVLVFDIGTNCWQLERCMYCGSDSILYCI